MSAGLADRAVVFVRAEPVDEVAFRDHILLRKHQRPELAEPDPLGDGTAVIAGEVHYGTDIDHLRLRGKPAFVEAAVLLFVSVQLRLDADLISLNIEVAVLVPVLGRDVFFGIDLTVIHKGDHIALLDAVAACLFARAGVRDEIELKEKERRALADMARDPHLLLVHDLGVLSEYLCIVFHDEAPFIFRSERVLRMMRFEVPFSCLRSCQKARKNAKQARKSLVFGS